MQKCICTTFLSPSINKDILIQPFSGDIVSRYSFANPSSARNGLEYLVKYDLIEFSSGTYYISDRFMALWLQRRFAASHS